MNRLATETSPYLLQHSKNPVDWYAWGEEAFNAAEKENKPLFISIGYSTCHWCHVMERESFENPEVAELLNRNFISIKVDREEHPDVDHYYMEACQLMTGRGGWPLTLFAGADKLPFMAGTYFPRESVNGRIGFKELIERIAEVWKNNRSSLEGTINEIRDGIKSQLAVNPAGSFDEAIIKDAFEYFNNSYDEEYGGFGSAPKFPSPHNMLFLLRYRHHYNNDRALEIVENSVKHIFTGGIYDHVGGGFHRYSTDGEWIVPHFEKMLYDQATMILLLSDLYRITGNNFYKYFIESAADYAAAHLGSPVGAFYSAQDADSDGREGKFYLWNYKELNSFLSEYEIRFLEKYFNIRPEGNFKEEWGARSKGENILYFNNQFQDEFENIIEEFKPVRKKLLNARVERVKPLTDKKILTDWNSLMVYALANAAGATGNAELLKNAERAYSFIEANHLDGKKLYHSSAEGKRGESTILDDYAFYGLAGEMLFEYTGKSEYVKNSILIAEELINRFYDGEKKLFRLSENFFPSENITVFDNAYPSGNSASFLFLSRLGHCLKTDKYSKYLTGIYDNIPGIIKRHPYGASFLLNSLFNLYFEFKEAVIAGGGTNEGGGKLGRLQGLYEPDKAFIPVNRGNMVTLASENGFFSSFIADIEKLENEEGVEMLYICNRDGCSLPVEIHY